ncbi:aldo/keto reductase [Streptomyces sp. NPDC058603]|uniref:aldo/keto reductase n=1 Tax=Streptomyces sp. NPDC058603 TaxID=3346551 RepID=UPI00364A6739
MTHVPTTTLGDGLAVSALGYGAMGLSDVYGPAEQSESLATLHHALDRGVTFIDTADVYGAGQNERLVGRLLAERRAEVTVASKFGIVLGESGMGTEGMTTRGDAAYVRAAADATLERLGVGIIDLYYLHRRDVSVPVEETVGAMAELVAQGKVRHLGLSEVTAGELRRAHATHPIAAVQSEWSLWSRDVERAVVPTAAELGVGFVPYSPLGRGFLTGTDRAALAGDWRAGLPRFSEDAFDRNQAVVRAVRGLAAELGATPAQVALAWLRAQGERFGLPVVPIPGTRRAARVDENIGSLDIVLDGEQLGLLNGLAEGVVGRRSDNDDPNWVSDTRE